MSTISANTLFHFTDRKENILKILENGFMPHECKEFNSLSPNGYWYVPMVCFCDIPLSQIKEHKEWYGEYAIGMQKNWAIHKNITPVLYFNENTTLYKTIISNIEKILSGQLHSREMDNLLYHYAYMKPYKGEQIHKKDAKKKEKRFYDEREWRFVPLTDHFVSFISSYFGDKDSFIYETLPNLDLRPSDIYYIIVSQENEIFSLIEDIRSIMGKTYQQEEIDTLITRIISMERIQEDF